MDEKKYTTEELIQFIKKRKYISSNGVEKKIDLLDFCLLSGENPIDFFNKIKDKCSKEDLYGIKRFLTTSMTRKGWLNNYLSTNNIISIDYNYKGRILTEEEKKIIVEFLREHNIPICEVTYFGLVRKYIDGEIDFSKYIKEKPNRAK